MPIAPTCAIIGSGIAGLAAAIRVARMGHEVTVFEAAESPGGKLAELRTGGFRFDMGPSVLTMPGYMQELFDLCAEPLPDSLSPIPLDPVFTYFFPDGAAISTFADADRLADELAQKTTVRRGAVLELMRRARVKLELTDPVFLQRSLHRWANYFDRDTLRGILRFSEVEAFTTMARANARLLSDPKAEAIFNQYAGYNGSDPFRAPATLNVIAHYELGLGAFYPKGGMRCIVQELASLAGRQGVRFRLGTRVERITVQDGRATGICAGGKEERFGTVVSNADIHSTYQRLLSGQPQPRRTLSQPMSSSVIVFFWGIKGKFPMLGLHNMLMAADQREEFGAMFGRGTLSDDPSVYLHISSKLREGDAPDGCENWFAMVTVPPDTGQDWEAITERARQAVLRKAGRVTGTDIAPLILTEQVMTPKDIGSRTGSHQGAVFGNSSNGILAAFLRHPNFSGRIRNLYFCGGSVHPGAGIPLCLLSAKIVAEELGR